MPIQKIDMGNRNGRTDLKNALRDIAAPAISAVGLTAVVIDTPEIIAAVLVIGIILAIVTTVDLIFSKSRQFLQGIWLIGRTLVSGLDRIHDWVLSLFTWADDEIYLGYQDIAHGVHSLGEKLFNFFNGDNVNRLNAAESRLANVEAQLRNETQRAMNAEATLHAYIANNVTALSNRIGADEVNTTRSVNALLSSINKEIDDRNKAITAEHGALIDEANTRAKIDTLLQQEIDQLATALAKDVAGLQASISSEESQITSNAASAAAAISAATGEITALSGQLTQTEQEVTTLAETPPVVENVTNVTETTTAATIPWTIAQIAVLTELADDPCMCLSPIGGIDTLMALIAGLELDIL